MASREAMGHSIATALILGQLRPLGLGQSSQGRVLRRAFRRTTLAEPRSFRLDQISSTVSLFGRLLSVLVLKAIIREGIERVAQGVAPTRREHLEVGIVGQDPALL